MLKNYLKIAYRHISRNKLYPAINILGLAIGLTCTILIGLFVQNELSFDKHHENYKRIYRLESHFNIQESEDLFAATALPLGPALKLEYPHDVAEFCRFMNMDNNLFQYEEKQIFEENVYFTDSTLTDVFTHEFISGSPEDALNDPNEIILTESFAKRIFGDVDPIGKTLETGHGLIFTITGIIKDVPHNSHLRFEAIASFITLKQFFGADRFDSLASEAFWNIGFYSYIMLTENGNIQNVLDAYPDFNEKYIKPVGDKINSKFQLMVQPLADVHLHSHLGYDLPTGNIASVYTFSIVALFLLVIGCINYMNMATAQSANRATEIGIRKVVGAQKSYLRSQFMMESLILTFFALLLAFIATELLLPAFNEIANRHLSFNIAKNLNLVLGIVGIALIVGIVSGSYPAFYLSSFIPVEVLKRKLGKGKGTLRKILVLLQFSISIIMIVGTFTVIQQLNFLRDKNLGFDKENVVVLTVRDTTGVKNLDAFQEELLKHPQILKAGTSSSIPGQGYGILVQRYETLDGTMAEKGINFVFVDNDYIDVMDMKIIKGRNFDPELTTDLEESIIINEACANVLGWGDDPIGKKLGFGAGLDGTSTRDTRVIGVIQDFHYNSLHNNIDPILLLLSDRPLRNISLRIRQENIKNTITYIEEKWNEFCPTFPFEYTFLDDSLNKQYVAEQKIGRVFIYFSIMCIFIACLGLFGLASYTTEQRTHEIGIRKVMGASSQNIVLLLSEIFTKWVILANIIAWPVAYFALNNWLANFAYRIQLSLLTFILSGIIAFLIAILTVLFQSLKASKTNPSITLKYE
ncbi:MAG: ABC transporter permease [Candidatus Celaenobacter antarcticus]|nr:ABC transporter permease [Candidatus Celaenobacter antarcticus]MDP8314559.1 ABC transporter permease [Candidatus Celaenobacter antarcticus]